MTGPWFRGYARELEAREGSVGWSRGKSGKGGESFFQVGRAAESSGRDRDMAKVASLVRRKVIGRAS